MRTLKVTTVEDRSFVFSYKLESLEVSVTEDLNLTLYANTNGLTAALKMICAQQTCCLRPFSTNCFPRLILF